MAGKPKPFSLTRRQTLAGAAGLVVGAALPGCGPYYGLPMALDLDDLEIEGVFVEGSPEDDVAALTQADAAFALGVASGFLLDDVGKLAWTCYRGDRPLRLVVWRQQSDRTVAVADVPAPTTADGTFVRVRLPRLPSAIDCAFAFVELDDHGTPLARSPVGKLRARPLPTDRPVVTLGATGCTELGVGFQTVGAAAREDLDGFVLLGDTIYSDDAEGLAGLRGLWQATMATPEYRALRARTSLMAIWDDHEFANNFDPETLDRQRLADAKRSFYEHQPLERKADVPTELWRSHRFGRTVDVFLLDTRSERRPSTLGSTDEILSEAQMAWLSRGLVESEATFKLIVTGVPIGDVPVPEAENRWPGFKAQRDQLLALCASNDVDGALFLAGDIHMCWIGQPAAAGPGASLIEVGAGCGAKELLNPLSGLFVAPTFSYRAAVNNYATLRFDPERREVTVVHKTATEILNVATLHV